MTRYDLLLFLHLCGAVVWLGGSFILHVMAWRAEHAADPADMSRFFRDMEWTGRIFLPASLVVLASGIILVIDSPITFGSLWVVLALVGIAITVTIGAGVIGPAGGRIARRIEDEGPTEGVRDEIRRMMSIGRADYTVLALILFDMAIKPTGDDPGVLIGMALVLAAALAWGVTQARQAQPATASA
jgi:uncharacterized membrane protein